jgi:hypothetical protein
LQCLAGFAPRKEYYFKTTTYIGYPFMKNAPAGIVMRRWTEQRWLLDNIIRSVGIDWDQPRTISYNTPCGPEANADFAGIRERVKKYADISPAFEAAA